MESMDVIFSPWSIDCGHWKIHQSKSSREDENSYRGQEVLKTELFQMTNRISGKGESSMWQRHRNGVGNNGIYKALTSMEDLNFKTDGVFDKGENFAQVNEIDNLSVYDDSIVHSNEGRKYGSRKTSPAVTPRNQLHIDHRKCRKRECDICKPKMKNYHDLHVAIDPVLFTRWEVTGSSKDEWVTLKKVKYKINGLGQVIKSVDKPSAGKVKESTEIIRRKVRIKLDTLKGQKVVARWDHDGLYYPAVVLKCSDPRHALVKYDTGNETEVLTRNVIPTGGAVARPKLLVGDYVLMRVVNLDSNDECYVPAIIQVVPQNQEAQARFFTVIMYNGQKASTLRTYLVKISKERFELASMYIAEQQNENRKEVEDLVYVTPRWKKKKEISDKEHEQERPKTPEPEEIHPSKSPEDEDEEKSRTGNDDKDLSYIESNRSEISVNSKRKELEKLQRELQEKEERQERQMRKLKKRAKKLARLEDKFKDKSLYDVIEQDDGLGVPAANDTNGGIEEDSKMYKLLELRKNLPHVRPGEELIARWPDDGWYYRGMVKHYHGDYSYNLEDSTGFAERIWREDIISENDNRHQVIELDCKVIALHPDYSFSYAPACVTHINDNEIEVIFYDDKEATLPWNEVYLSSSEKYDIDVAYIIKQEKRLIGASVVARDDKTGVYYPGCITRHADNNVDYIVSWTDGTQSVQKCIHIFSAFTRRPPLSNGDRVLALADHIHVKFLPGYIVGSVDDNLVVKFCDGETCEGVDPMLCYWLEQRFYDDAVKYYKSHDPSFY